MDAMRPIAQWASIVIAPLVFLANLSLAYALVPLACATPWKRPAARETLPS